MSLPVTNNGDNPFVPGVSAQSYTPDQLIAGDLKLVTTTVTIASGNGVTTRGTVLGKVTASGKYITSLSAAADGSQNPLAIAADTVDATSADQTVGVYLMGEFNGNALTLGAGWTLTTVTAALRSIGIFIKSAVSAADPS